MPRAVLRKGAICLVEPVPPDWRDGTELRVEKSSDNGNGATAPSTDQWMDEVEAQAARIPAGEDDKLADAIAEIRQQAKDLARKGKR
jgi:hypothetical protein